VGVMKKVSNFISTGQGTTGKTPSFQAKLEGDTTGTRYQIKRSNYINKLRRWIGLDPDQSDILGEYIASRVTANLLNKKAPPDLAPAVDLIYNKNQHDFSLASKYLNDRTQGFIGMTLGELIEDKDKLKAQKDVKNLNKLSEYLNTLNKIESVLELSTPRQKVLANLVKDSIENLDSIFQEIEQTKKVEEPYEKRRKKTKLVFGKASDNQLSMDESCIIEIDDVSEVVSINKVELYNALASSIILGDHDINPNNFYAIIDKTTKEVRIGRIDLGHAFNDLIKNWMVGSHTPNINGNRGTVLDFLNRKKENGGVTKFNRHIDRGIILDPEFAQALRDQTENITGTLDTCKGELLELMQADNKVRKKLIKSAETLQKRIGVTGVFDKITHQIGNIPNKTLRNIIGVTVLFTRKLLQVLLFIPKKILSIPKKLAMLIPPVRNYYEQQQHQLDEKLINNLFDDCNKYITKNQEESRSVANLIDIQIIVKNLLKKENPTEIDVNKATDKIKDIYQTDQNYLKNKSFKDKVEWVNSNESSKPLKMNLNKYIKTQAKKLGKKHLAKQIVKTLKSKNIASQERDEKVNQKNTTEKVFIQNTSLNQHHSHHASDVGQHHTLSTTLDLAIKNHNLEKPFCSGVKSLNNKSAPNIRRY
jgi:uncharacterized protein YdaU (DUF1376 family)